MKTSTEAWRVSADNVANIVVFPKPEDCKKALEKKSSDIVLLHLKESLTVRNQKKPVAQVSFVLPATLPAWKNAPTDSLPSDPTVAWNHVWQRVFGNDTSLVRVHHPAAASPSAFTSYQADRVSTTSGGLPFITCYHGTKDGVLFPLTDGSLLFHKPPFLVSPLDSISIGGRGGGNSRYADLAVHSNGETIEFTNVNRDEVEGLQKFMAAGAAAMDDEEDEPTGSRQRSKRKASVDARRINKRIVVSAPVAEEDEDEDIDYMAGTAVDEDDEDSDDDDDSDANPEEEMEEADDDDDDDDDAEVDVVEMKDSGDETEDDTESEG